MTWLLSLGILGASGGVGWVLMKTVSPTREEMLKILPESDPEVMKESRKRSQEWMDAIKAAAENPNPIHMTSHPYIPKRD